ncbi:MAG: glycosyltransferase family 4 protein [Cyanobacteria bacterium P01_G01_bin.39]
MTTNKISDMQIAWLLPKIGFFWQPMLSEFTKLFPKTNVFTAKFPSFVKGLENSIAVETIGSPYQLGTKTQAPGYSCTMTMVSPKIVFPLIRFKPKVIFSNSFGIWTIFALLLKPLYRWRVIIAYEGSSPGVDFANSPFRLWMRRLMIKVADACITNSKRGEAYLTKVLDAKQDRVFAYPYEVPTTESLSHNSSQALIKSKLQRPVFLFVGRVVPRKGLGILLKACKLLKDRGYDNYTLLVLGDGEEREELEAFCQTHELENVVEWKGWISNDSLNSYFKSSDVFILPTLEDTWGVVIHEAMLFSKAIICSDAAGSSELVKHNCNGYIFPSQQIEKLAELMSQFIDNPDLITQMGKQSQLLIANYTPKSAAQFLAEVTDSILS